VPQGKRLLHGILSFRSETSKKRAPAASKARESVSV
jgi:hypothetical protein